MCRSIKPLFNFDPPASNEEIEAACLQFVRKVSGMRKPSRANEAAFENAVAQISTITQQLLNALSTTASPKNREAEASKAKRRARSRYGR